MYGKKYPMNINFKIEKECKMKKIYLILALLVAAGVGYGAAQIQIKMEQVKTITQYVGAPISRYDLGDTECFVESTSHSMFCMRK